MERTVATSDGMNRLNAVIAALAQLKPSLQPSTLRTYLEYGLERMQGIEEEHYVFLAECAQLAASNVQDVRLQDLEKQVRDADGADERSWGATVAAIALNVAIQIAVLATLEGAGALGSAGAGQRALSETIGTTVRNLRASQSDLGKLQDDAAEAQSAINYLLSIKAKDKLASRTTQTVKISSGGETRTVRRDSIEDWLAVIEELVARREDALSKAQLSQLVESGKAADLSRVLQAFDSGWVAGDSGAIDKYWADWREFVGGERGNLLMGPLQTTFEQVSAEWRRARGDTESADPFLGSTVTGHFFTWTSQERLRIQEQYSNFRVAVRYAPDDDMTSGSDLVKFLAYLVAEQLPKWQSLRLAAYAARPWIVSGFEAAFWREYLAANGMLVVEHDVSYNGVFDYVPPYRGDIRFGHLMKEDAPVGHPTAKADFFHGVATMTEMQADYLFRRYAKRWIDAMSDPSSVTQFEYKPENYANATAEVFGFLPNVARVRRINQMRVIVILYFLSLDAFEPDERLKPLLGISESLGSKDGSMRGTIGIPPGPPT